MENQEILRLEYIQLNQFVLWDNNTKRHDIGTLILSFKEHGFKDPPKFEPKLNGGRGGIVEGNGRSIALVKMYHENPQKPPRGVLLQDGGWLVPVLFGVDAESEWAAEAYGYDHNLTNLAGGDNSMTVYLAQFEKDFTNRLAAVMGGGARSVMFDGVDLKRLQDIQKKDETPIVLGNSGENDSGDENGKKKTEPHLVSCPKCGFAFDPEV